MRCGADTGGTFTDIVADGGRVLKVLSTPDDPSRAVADGLRHWLPSGRPALLAHGTTVSLTLQRARPGARWDSDDAPLCHAWEHRSPRENP